MQVQIRTLRWWILVSRLAKVLTTIKCFFFAINWRCTCTSAYIWNQIFHLLLTATPTGSLDDDFCKEELYRNITWMRTPKGKTIERQCPYGFSGEKWCAHALIFVWYSKHTPQPKDHFVQFHLMKFETYWHILKLHSVDFAFYIERIL